MMKAFSFLTILESLSKKLSILRTKMHSDNLRVNHGTITRVLRVSRPFSRTSFCASFGLSRRVSHFAAILTILFTVGVGSVWGEDYLINVESSNLSNDSKWYEVESVGGVTNKTGSTWSDADYECTPTGAKTGDKNFTIRTDKDNTTEIKVNVSSTSNRTISSVKTSTSLSSFSEATNCTPNGTVTKNTCDQVLTFTFNPAINAGTYVNIAVSGNLNVHAVTITTTSATTPVTSVSLNKTTTTLEIGETETLTATITPNNATNKNVAWSSSNESVATVQNGVVTAVAAGTATITVTTEDGNKTATCVITVNAASGGGGDGDGNCAEPELREFEIARFFVPCNLENAVANDKTAWIVTGQASSTNANTFSTYKFGGGKDNWYTNASTGFSYGKLSADDAYIQMKLTSGEFQAGDIVSLYVNRNNQTKTSLKLKSTSGNEILISTTSAGVEASGSYTLTANDIESDGSLKFFRASSSTFVNRIIITRPASSTPEPTTYTVSFDTHGGGNVDAISQSSAGAAITLPAAPTKTGYTFAGWYTAATGGTKAGDANASYIPTATITLHAQWTENPPVTPEPEDVAGEDFPNPERGFYEHAEWSHKDQKNYNDNLGDGYFTRAAAANRSLLLRIYYLDTDELRQNKQLPDGFITMFNNDMQKIRSKGMKCILRFAYDKNTNEDGDEDYNDFDDASPETWATHLAQLKPYLQANADVIYVVQAGFLGVWGEWYYSKQGTGDGISKEIKKNLIDQLLDAVPANRCVQLRTPKFKRDYLDIDEPLTSTEAYKGTAQARLGHHNDAFLNGEENQGTYEYGKRTTDMAYIAQECLYVPIGGETNLEASQVNDLYDKYCKGTVAEAEMAQLHYSYLNYSYSTVVTNKWRDEGSYARMSKQLGYRFELESATLPNEATAGTQMNVKLNIKNVGYAPLYNERYAYIVLKNNTNTYSIKLSSDPRTWAPNSATTAINENVTLPVDMQAGTYDMYLHLPDASDNIANNPKYAVRFANQGIWEETTGYNKLNKQVVVTATDFDTYTITYTLNGGEGTVPTEQTAVEGQSVTLATATGFSKAGYTFAGWNDGTTTYAAGATYTMPASNVTLTAQWNINKYTITFINGETVLQTSTIEYGATPAYNDAEPTKAADAQYTYTFSGWSPEITAVTGNATYTATFAQTAKNYTLTWDVNGGNALTGDYTTGTVAYGTTIAKPADPTREGYTFAGWSPAVAATMPAANTTYTAQWNEIEVASITVNPTTLDLKKGESATLTATVSPNNALNKTVTWDNTTITTLSSETGNSITVTGKSNGKDKELKASAGGKQATVKVSVYYEVQYNSNGGSECTSGKYYDDNNGVTLPTPTRDGYTFAGWYENEALTQFAGAAGDTYKPSDNITLYAKWTVAKTNPTTTWNVAETVYAGQLVTVSVTTNSDATLTTGSLTTNKGQLVNATVNGQTITATLQVPGDASGTITLTLRTDATENYNASTSTKTITLSECPTNGGGGEVTTTLIKINLSITDDNKNNTSGVEATGGTPGGTAYWDKMDTESPYKLNTNGAYVALKLKSGYFQNGDVLKLDGNKAMHVYTGAHGSGKELGTTEGPSNGVITYTLNNLPNNTNEIYIYRSSKTYNGTLTYMQVDRTTTSSGSGESTLPTYLDWTTDPSAEVEKQVGDANFTYTASSNNSAGAITYSSSNTSVATVNQTTGEVTTKAAGTAIITATIAEIGCYPTKSITYTLTVTSTGTPEPTTYTVTYNLGGGTGTLPTQAAMTAGGTFTLASSNNITKSGYTFAGWSDGTNTYAAGATYTMPANDVTLTAQWTPEPYNINYYEAVGEVNDISGLNKISIVGAPTSYTIEDAVTLPALPDKDGYKATGWYNQWCVFEDGGNGKGWNGCETTTGHLAGYYGHANYIVKYTAEPGTLYTVTVNSATNGTVAANKTTNVAQGETVTLTVTPASGYELGTLTVKDASDNNVTVTDNTFIMPASNVTVSATFTAIETPEPGSYTLTYDENQPAVWNNDFAVKNIPAAQTLTNGTGNVYNGNTPVITEDADSDYPIYTFIGWNTAANGSGTSYAAGAAITIKENTILYAQWTPCTYDVKYFDQDKETPLEGMVNTTYTFGVGIPTLPTPTKPGHTFIRWHLFYDGEGGTIKEEPVVSLANDIWGVLQLAAQWEVNCNMPTTTFANTRYTIGSGALNLSDFIDNNNSGGAITYAVTGGVAATIDGSSFTCDRIGVVTVTATQAANGGYCEKIMTATINVAMPVTDDGCAQMFTFKANNDISNPDGQKGSSYLDLSSYATINGLSTTGKVGIKDMDNNNKTSTTLIKNSEIYFPNTNTYLKVENLSTPLAAGDEISIGTQQSATEYIITISGTQCTSNCITTTNQQYTIPAGSSLIGVTTFYIWAKTEQTHLNTINICRPAYKITYNANNGTAEYVESENAVLVAGCPNTFTVPAGKQFAGWKDGTGTSYSVGTIIPEDNLILYAQWECIEPVFTVSCDKTAYAKDEADAKPITVSVTAGNSGGVTYQWFASDKNDRTTGTAINSATADSYTPSTTTAGTTYYWCEISNSCTTVKTPTIAITVTVTKNNPAVTWSDPSDVNYGGGGYSISATVNNEWNGTLLPSMLTAPTGINLYDIEINGKTITAKFDVTTTFDRTAEKIPFVLTLPETTTYNPFVSENKVNYDACATGGTKHRIPVKETSVQQDINPYNRWDTENIGWITWDQGGGTISSESATYNNFSYRTKSGKQVILIYSKIQEVKTIRIYGYGSNATQCTAVSVGKEYNKYTKLSASEYAFNGNTINNRENGVIEISFTTPLKEGTYVQFNFSKNALFYGVELETEGGEEIVTTLSFATPEPSPKTQNDANFTNKATPSNNTLGTVTYSSSNANVATVNSTTGEVSIINAGTTTITATLAPSGCYQGAKATYELTVTEQTCNIAAGTLSASKTDKYDCEEVTLTLSNYEQGATIQWCHNGEAINSKPGITINGNTLTTTLEGTYSALVTKDCFVRSNSVTITNIASASATPLVSEWYIKNGRLTPPIALWKLEGGARIAGVGWMKGEEESTAPYDNPENVIYVENGIVYLTGTPPQANNETGEDIRYTIQLNIYNSCDDSPMVVPSTITIVHQKNTDKHVLAFVVTGKEKGGFTEEITTAQTTNVPLYNKISQEFDVLATNIYATDNEQLLKEYYSRFDIICITDYPNSKETGVNGKSYTNAMGALIDIRPILSMEAWVSKYSNWNDKGVTGDPKSPTTRQYSMLLQCKDHEIFAGTNLIQEGSGDELMYRVTMVDKNQEQYKTLDDRFGAQTPHAEKATTKQGEEEIITGYGYGSNPALQGFTYTSSMSSMLPIGIIDDGDGNNLQVGLERQYEIEARMIVLGVNSYAMERLTDDGERVIINTLKYLMKKQSSEIADCSIYFDNNNGKGDNQWNNPANWAPSRNSLPHASQEARILAPCIVSDVVAKVASIKIVPDGKYAPAYNGGIDAKGSLTIAPDGALVVGGHIQAATAPNYYEARPTTPENLIVKADATGSGALIHGEENGELGATVELVSKAYSVKELNEQTGKYKKKKYWQYVALPVREALAEDAFWGAYTYQYDEAKGWIKKGTGERIEEFWGVGLSIDNEVYSGANNEQALTKFTIKGNLALAIDRDIDLTKTPDAGEGQNMIGNSWTAPIHLTSMTAEDFENATATVYIYNTGRDEQASGSEGTASSANGSTQAGQWISIPVAATALDPWQGPKVIPAMQAFEVDLAEGESGGILHLNYDKHVRTIATPEEENLPLRAPKYPSDRPSMIRLRVADSTTYTDLYLIEGDQFTDEFDNAWDGKYQPCDGRSATLYAMSPIGDMAVLAQPSVNNTSVVFEPGKKSEYVFTFGYNGDITYYLNDMQLKTSTEIKEGNEYRFTYNKGDMKNRFLVTRESFDSPNISTGLANIVTDGNGLQVTNPNQENLQVILIDAAGRLCSIYNTAEPMFNIELPATQGVYMINVKGETTNIVRKVVK